MQISSLKFLKILYPFAYGTELALLRNRSISSVVKITSGVSIKTIYQQLIQKRHLACYHRLKLVKHLLPDCNSIPSFKEWMSHVPSNAPSRHSISSCFLLQFWEKEHLYLKHMQSMSLEANEEWLSCDHTFSSAGMYLSHIYYIHLLS